MRWCYPARAPSATVIDFAGGEIVQDITLDDELTVSGTVTCDGRLAPGALVALSEAMGKHIDSTHCDDRGRYSFQLPPTGRYVLIAYDSPTGRAHARKVSLTIESQVVDIAIPLGSTNRSADRRDSEAVTGLPWDAPATHT
ncbi:carboxypeptidase-like regulatory domain-containing protein [Rhodococcus sp. C26F]